MYFTLAPASRHTRARTRTERPGRRSTEGPHAAQHRVVCTCPKNALQDCGGASLVRKTGKKRNQLGRIEFAVELDVRTALTSSPPCKMLPTNATTPVCTLRTRIQTPPAHACRGREQLFFQDDIYTVCGEQVRYKTTHNHCYASPT